MGVTFDNNLSVEDYLMLISAVDWKPLKDAQVKRALDHTMYLVRAAVNGETVGMARLVGDYGAHGLLTDVVVLPKFQGKRIGSMLVQNILEYINNYVCEGEKFIIEMCPTAGKRAFYQRLGFKYKPENMDGMYLWIKK